MKRLLLLLVVVVGITLDQNSTAMVSSPADDIELGDIYYIMNDEIVLVAVYGYLDNEHLEGIKAATAELYRTPDGRGG